MSFMQDFIYFTYVGFVNYCYVTSLDNSLNSMTIDGYTGTHLANKNDNDVKGIWIYDTNTNFIPENLGFLFNSIIFQLTPLYDTLVKDWESEMPRNLYEKRKYM